MSLLYEPLARGLPRRSRGYQSEDARWRYDADVAAFCKRILAWDKLNGFKVSARGWAYILEGKGEITKGDFKAAEKLINDCRKDGTLPVDICLDDEGRATEGIEDLDDDVDDEIERWEYTLGCAPDNYTPVSFWEDQTYYVEMRVEKVDLKSLFKPICDEYHIPIANQSGWADLLSRTRMLVRMYLHWRKYGNIPVLLYCGDFDPGGLSISDWMRDNLKEMAAATAYILRRDHGIKVTKEEIEDFIDTIEIVRFGLNYDFIEENNLTWIDNLETGSGKRLDDPSHPDHDKAYVQDYIRQYGARKVEANALVVAPEAGRKLCRNAILEYVDADAPDEYEASLEEPRDELRRAMFKRFNVGEPPDDEPDDPDDGGEGPDDGGEEGPDGGSDDVPPTPPEPPPAPPAPPRLRLVRPTRDEPPPEPPRPPEGARISLAQNVEIGVGILGYGGEPAAPCLYEILLDLIADMFAVQRLRALD